MTQSRDIEISVIIKGETDAAYRVDFGGKEEGWVPKSQISDVGEEGGRIISIFIPEWLALKKGMI